MGVWSLLLLAALGAVALGGALDQDLGGQAPVTESLRSQVLEILTASGVNKGNCSHALLGEGRNPGDLINRLLVSPSLSGSRLLQQLPAWAEEPQAENGTALDWGALAHNTKQILSTVECSSLVLVCDDAAIARQIGDSFLLASVVKWNTRVLWVTGAAPSDLQPLLSTHWFFSMMNTAVLNWRQDGDGVRSRVLEQIPFSPSGSVTETIATFDPNSRMRQLLPLYPEKYNNFNGQVINITALPYAPFWDELKPASEEGGPVYSGADYEKLAAMGQALNFSFRNLPTKDWEEVVLKVEKFESLLAPVMHYMYPIRKLRYDYTFVYDISETALCLLKPVVAPKWESLLYPLNLTVWLALLVALLVIPIPLTLMAVAVFRADYSDIADTDQQQTDGKLALLGSNFMLAWRIILAQGLPDNLPRTHSYRTTLLSWMLLSFITTTMYKSNLIAHLTLPKPPPRVESLAQLVQTGGTASGSPYATHMQDYLRSSNSPDYQYLANNMGFVDNLVQGLELVMEKGVTVYTDDRIYVQYQIAQKFSDLNGESQLYIAREGFLTGYLSFPIPHNAPFAEQFDKWISIMVEAGLHNKWIKVEIDKLLRRKRIAAREVAAAAAAAGDVDQATAETKEASKTTSSSKILALTLVHIQGPLLLLLGGWIMGLLAFLVEIGWSSKNNK